MPRLSRVRVAMLRSFGHCHGVPSAKVVLAAMRYTKVVPAAGCSAANNKMKDCLPRCHRRVTVDGVGDNVVLRVGIVHYPRDTVPARFSWPQL